MHGALRTTTATGALAPETKVTDGDEDEDAGHERERDGVPKTWKLLGLEGAGNLASTASSDAEAWDNREGMREPGLGAPDGDVRYCHMQVTNAVNESSEVVEDDRHRWDRRDGTEHDVPVGSAVG